MNEQEARPLDKRPFVFVNVPRSIIPEYDWLDKYYRLDPVVRYIAEQVGTETILGNTLIHPASLHFAFRGIQRKRIPDEQLVRYLQESTYRSAIENIELHGVERNPDGNKFHFVPSDPRLAIAYSLPREETEVGLLIISREEGLLIDNVSQRARPCNGNTFKTLHVGTIQLQLI